MMEFKNMKNKYMTLLTIAFGLAGTMTLKADTGYDLIFGITQEGANPRGSDVLYDIGSVVSYPGASVLYNGETWNFSSLISTQGYNMGATNLQWGVIGDANTADDANPEATWVTTSGFTPNTINGGTAFNNLQTSLNALLGNFTSFPNPGSNTIVTATSDTSWNEETINGTESAQILQTFGYSPNVTGTNGTATLWQILDNNSSPTNLGTFTLSTAGILTFNVVSTTPPPPQIMSITRLDNISTVYFTTTNGSFIYKLYFTNSSGLTAPVSTWPTSSTTVTGNGLTNNLTDTTATTNRFYLIGVTPP
jgi:hypothetical protein